jgi:cation:H+ antiporter
MALNIRPEHLGLRLMMWGMNLSTLILFIIGLALLLAGAELLVRGAARLATAVGIPPLIVGLTVVSFCTSSPEMAVSASSALAGEADLALGNVIGSNIFNILFILGLSAMVAPLLVKMQLIRFDVPIAVAASVAVWVMGMSGSISRLAGVLLFAGIVAYIVFLIRQARREKNADVKAEFESEYGRQPGNAKKMMIHIGMLAGGLVMLVIGSNWMVNGAVTLAHWLGVDDVLIGLTILAVGTSLPEIATSVMASVRGERDIAVGNVIGSNIFNLLAVLGLTAALSPNGVPVPADMIRFELPVMIAVTAVCIPIFFIGMSVTRGEGAALLGFYIAFTLFLILEATASPAAGFFGAALIVLGIIAFIIFFAQAFVDYRKRRLQSSL